MAIQADHRDVKSLVMRDASQFHIPIYQRSYTWEAGNQIKKLFDDILEFSREYRNKSRADYYIGNIIIKNQTRGMVTERVVIDGQQRITTTILILCAIRSMYEDVFKSEESRRQAKMISRALYEEDDGEFKLILNNMEYQSTLSSILIGTPGAITARDKATTYWRNYNYLIERLENHGKKKFDEFVEVLSRVKVVVISLDEDQDENSVFESINSLGKPLAGSDLIKNYLFTFKNYECSHAKEKELTDFYTKSFESLFINEKNREESLESFFREYLALKTQILVKKDPKTVYYGFKYYVGEINSVDECFEWIHDIVKWGVIYQTLRIGENGAINQQYLGYLRSSFGTYASLLMDMVDRYSTVEGGTLTVLNEEEVNSAFKAVVAYDVARFLAGAPVKEITRFIPTVRKKISEIGEQCPTSYAEAFKMLVTNTQEGYGQQSLQYLRRSVLDRDLYNSRKKQLLRFLVLVENIGKREILSFENDLKGCEIEHVMPQNLTEKWHHISSEDHEKYLHTLGNLSLTFDNSSLSNNGFDEKRKFLLEKSRIKINNILSDFDIFDKSAIKKRASILLELFANEYDLKEKSFNESTACDQIEKTGGLISNTLLDHKLAKGLDVQMSHNSARAYGILDGKKILVLEGSEALIEEQPSLQEGLKAKRAELLRNGDLIEERGRLVFCKDIEFNSSSMAAGVIAGFSINGRLAWKDSHGKSLKELNV